MAVTVQQPGDYTSGQRAKANPDGKDFGELAIQNAGMIKDGGSAIQNNNAAFGLLSPQQAQVYNNSESQVLAKAGLTLSQYNALAQTNTISPAIQSQVTGAIDQNYNATVNPSTWLDKLASTVALGMTVGIATAGLGAVVGPALGSIATGALTGAAGTALTDALTGQPLTAGSVGKGAVMGAAGAAAAPLAGQLSNATGMSNQFSTGLIKSGMGALGSAVNGSNPLAGAVAGGVSSAVGSGLNSAGLGMAGGFLGSQLGGLAGQAVAGQPGQTNMMGQGNANVPSGGGITNPFGAGTPLNSFMSGIGSLAGPVLSGMAANNQASMQTNGYTTAGNAANSGNQFGFSGLGGMGGQYANGQLGLTGGSMNPAAGQFSQFANNQGAMANQFGMGGVPSNVTGAYNNFNGQIGMGQGNANSGASTAMGVMGLGASTLNSAGANQQSAYQTALTSGQAALNPQIQQQSNALLNSNFARGMSGSSGGALQTQALQNSFNTAELQNQNQATTQGLNAYNSTINAGTGMFNSGASQAGNFNNQGVSFGSQGLTGAQSYSAFSPQLAGMYQGNANSAATGFSTINNAALGNFSAGLGAITNQGNQMNKGAATQVGSANSYNGGLAGYAGGVLGSPGSMSNLMGGAASLFNGLSGLSGSNPTDYSSIFGTGGNLSYGNVTGNMGMPDFSASQMGAQLPTSNDYSSDYGLGGW
jgi:hypothetical protein